MIVAKERISAAVLSSTQAVAETSADSTPVPVEAESMPGLVAAELVSTLAVAAETSADPDSTPARAESMPGVGTAVAARPAGAVTPAELVSTPVAAETSADPDSTPARAESAPGLVTAARPAGAVTLAVLVSTPAVAETSDSHACMQMHVPGAVRITHHGWGFRAGNGGGERALFLRGLAILFTGGGSRRGG